MQAERAGDAGLDSRLKVDVADSFARSRVTVANGKDGVERVPCCAVKGFGMRSRPRSATKPSPLAAHPCRFWLGAGR